MNLPNQTEYVLLIMNCTQYKWKAEQQKTMWIPQVFFNNNNELANNKKMTYFHVRGDPSLKEEHSLDNENNILLVKVEDDYNSLPKKVVAAFQAISSEFPYLKYIFKTDDDQDLKDPFEFFSTMIRTLEEKKPKVHYGGHVVDVKTPYLSSYGKIHPELPDPLIIYPTQYCSGRFYTLSIEAAKDLVKKRGSIMGECLEDYAMGYHLNPIFKKTILNIDTSVHFTDSQLK